MAPVACLIRDLNPASVTSALKVQLVRAFAVPGGRIHETIQNTLIPTFKPLLEEGCLYGIKNFIVTQNANKYKTTENKYKIIFLKRTRVCKLFDDAFPRCVYTFKSFEVIKSMENIYDAGLFDVVGVVKEMGQPENRVSSNGKQSKLIELMLEDIEGNRLSCTLWEEYVDQFLKYCGKTCGAPKIMILQMAKLNMYRGEIKVVNTYYVTKVVMDSEVPEIRSFKERLGADCSLLDTIVISSISNGSSFTISNELCAGQNVLKTIAQLFDGTEYYISCKKCPKKLQKIENRFFCGKCNKYDVSGNLRYKLKVHVVDETGSALFLLWDRECLQLIGRSAGELNTKNVVEEVDILSEIEEALVDKKMMFKVNVRGEECMGAYTVAKIITDPIIVNTYFGHLLDSQESNCISNLETSNVNDEKALFGQLEQDTPIEPPSSSRDEDKVRHLAAALRKLDQSKDEKALFGQLEQDTPIVPPSSSRDGTSSSKEIGSVKRCSADSFSSTDASKKTKVFIKKEKE
ncbi:hypothetical protein C2S52_015438 [Perilla frutescens var. hirtella]|nr:hypothetical protein C2S52_015438 [Perilla frutescens var. hirtella]